MDGCVGEAVMMEEAHLLVEQAVDYMGSGILPLNQADQLTIQGGAQVHGPVVAVQGHLVGKQRKYINRRIKVFEFSF